MADVLRDNEVLTSITSHNNLFQLRFQGSDGNVILAQPANDRARWHSGTGGQGATSAIMQSDGNFVVYGPQGAIWATGTHGYPGAVLVLQDDGNLVIYDTGGRPLWATGTFGFDTVLEGEAAGESEGAWGTRGVSLTFRFSVDFRQASIIDFTLIREKFTIPVFGEGIAEVSGSGSATLDPTTGQMVLNGHLTGSADFPLPFGLGDFQAFSPLTLRTDQGPGAPHDRATNRIVLFGESVITGGAVEGRRYNVTLSGTLVLPR